MYSIKGYFIVGLLFCSILVLSIGVGRIECQPKYPTRPIDVIVPFAPGGSTDLTVRVVTAALKKKWNVPINVVNKPGGNTVPASIEVYNAKPDGYTVLADGTPSCSMLPAVVKKIPFEVMDRTFLGSIGICPFVFSVAPSSPLKSMKDAEAEAKRNPDEFTWASLGGAALQDFAFRQLIRTFGVDVLKTKPVMSQGGSQSIVITAGGNVKVGGSALPSSIVALKGNMVRGLAITSKTRWSDFPDLPTTAEVGYPMVTATEYKSFACPPNTPSYVVEAWEKTLKELANDPEVVAQLKSVGMLPFYHDSAGVKEYTLREMTEIKELWGIK
jgi:tripartite-type tricarboxylate transporter receptor subunit TctC